VAVDVMSGVLRERAAAGVPVLFSSHQLDLVERLCDRVGIIKDGQMVAEGAIDDLRSAGRPQWFVDGAAASAWAPSLSGSGLLVVSSEGPRTVVELDGVSTAARALATDAAAQAVLRAALAAGPVRSFTPVRHSLVELYRDVVSAPTEEPDP
jgi:ABC-2 type transport system ATP-binding protein